VEWKQKDGLRWLTRLGGLSEGGYAELNLGYLTGDRPEAVRTNRRRLAAALGLGPERIVIGRQVHGAELARHSGPQEPSPFAEPGCCDPPEVDGHVAGADAGLGLLVFVADCLPIALAGGDGIAMVHGGWRGLAAGIAGDGAAAVGATAAAIGPGIGPCCFEVGEEVLAAFAPLGPGLAEGRMLDLPAVAVRLLERAGVADFEVSGVCTRCEPDLFFSHRGQGPETGRQAGIVWSEA
jgi:YfiH family protein